MLEEYNDVLGSPYSYKQTVEYKYDYSGNLIKLNFYRGENFKYSGTVTYDLSGNPEEVADESGFLKYQYKYGQNAYRIFPHNEYVVPALDLLLTFHLSESQPVENYFLPFMHEIATISQIRANKMGTTCTLSYQHDQS